MIDLLIAGGGPAGLATALYAARAGLSAVVVEPRGTPIDKACGEGLMPGAVRALRELGIEAPGHPLRGIRYLDGAHTATSRFRDGLGAGVRRTELHAVLHDQVLRSPVTMVVGRVGELHQDEDSVRAGGLTARYLVAADGLHSSVRRGLDLERRPPARLRPRWGLRAHFETRPWTDHVEVYWSRHGEAYVTPIGHDRVGVAVLTAGRAPFEEHLRGFPDLAGRLPARPVGRVLAAGPLRQDVARRVAGRVALVGDAAGYVDALTGEGLALAFAAAAELVDSVVADDLARYEARWRQITRRYRLITSTLLTVTRPVPVRDRIVAAAARAPWLFGAAVGQLAR